MISDSAFVKYLKSLPYDLRVAHSFECAMADGSLFWELAGFLDEYDPKKIASLLEDVKSEKKS